MIKRFDHPATRRNPYPPAPTGIHAFRYDSALVLLRLKDAVRLRTGEDADFILARDFLVSWEDDEGTRHVLCVPAGLITDLTSVPPVWRWLVGRVGPWLEAAIVHDYLYIAWQDVPGRRAVPADRRFADDMMRAAMQAARVAPWRIALIYGALRVFGGTRYARGAKDRYLDPCAPAVTSQLVAEAPQARSDQDDR